MDTFAPIAKAEAQYATYFSDFLKQYRRQAIEPARDLLDNRWRIDISARLPEFDTTGAYAYAAGDTADGSKACFALICNPGSLTRYGAVAALRDNEHPHLLQILAAGPVMLSQPQEERFAIVYKKPIGKKLSEVVAMHKGPVNEHFVRQNLIAPIASAIDHLARLGIPHGSINPENIYFHDTAVLGDCLTVPCGYDQPFLYETLERQQMLPAGKGASSVAQDYYALAVVTLYVLYGPQHFDGFTPQSLPIALMREGPYGALSRGREHPENFYDFFRGSLCVRNHDRWDYGAIKPWLDGRRYNVLLPAPPQAIRPFELNGLQANSRREVAHLLYTHSDLIPSVLESGQLVQWVTINLRSKELTESITRLTKSALEFFGKNETSYHEQVMRILLLLDPAGPIRIGSIAMHPHGLSTLCAEFVATKAEKPQQLLLKFIELNMINYWFEAQKKEVDYVVSEADSNLLTKLEKLRLHSRTTGYGFGIQRIVYDLNPDLPCRSELFVGRHAGNLREMLSLLDRLAGDAPPDTDPMDRQIAAYIAGKTNLQHELRIPELSSMPSLAANRSILALKLLASAQTKTEAMALPGLTHWLGLRIAPALAALRGRSLRRQMLNRLAQSAQTGALPVMADVVLRADYAASDEEGFTEARALYHNSTAQIKSYQRGDDIDRTSTRLGGTMAKIAAYAALMITVFSILGER